MKIFPAAYTPFLCPLLSPLPPRGNLETHARTECSLYIPAQPPLPRLRRSRGGDDILNEARAIRDGGGNGSIIGRNTFQRPRAEALKLLDGIIGVYKDGK